MNPLKQFRTSRGMTQLAFAQRAGLHQPTLSLLERSVRTREEPEQDGATAVHAARIARAFGREITEDQILYPGNYMTAEEIQNVLAEVEAAA